MAELTVLEHLTLDGVMQAPGRPDEDTRDGFVHGGWADEDNDEVMGRIMGERMAAGGALLFGRRTYEDLFSWWPNQTDNPFTAVLDATTKYVASTTLIEPLPWQHSVLLHGDLGDAVRAAKEESGDLGVMGSGVLVRSLAELDLVDRYLLMIHPLVLGTGRRLFADGSPYARLRMLDSVTTTKGVVIATLEPAR